MFKLGTEIVFFDGDEEKEYTGGRLLGGETKGDDEWTGGRPVDGLVNEKV